MLQWLESFLFAAFSFLRILIQILVFCYTYKWCKKPKDHISFPFGAGLSKYFRKQPLWILERPTDALLP